jgi:RecQ-mediated genome instability protein 1
VVVQVLDLEDVSRSRWEQVEELEAIQRGEGTRGREVIRLPVAVEDGEESGEGEGEQQQEQRQQRQGQSAGGKNSTHKLVVQDCKGQKAYALELKRVDRIAVGKTSIGEKILLKAGTTVARGVLMLEPGQCVVLGGKVEAWHRAWVDGRLARLKEAAAADGADSG